ncbi:hypothetical protein DHBDCA_p454 [Dehalobacter sp. DCA]|nr:hypothetical protein DHBDCA_p454 [Dehalobacter sp. DCA]
MFDLCLIREYIFYRPRKTFETLESFFSETKATAKRLGISQVF